MSGKALTNLTIKIVHLTLVQNQVSFYPFVHLWDLEMRPGLYMLNTMMYYKRSASFDLASKYILSSKSLHLTFFASHFLSSCSLSNPNRRHKNKEECCWVIVDGNVYDVTKLLKSHPGGMFSVLDHGGRDATKIFNDMCHSDAARAKLETMKIGTIDPSIPLQRRFSAAAATVDDKSAALTSAVSSDKAGSPMSMEGKRSLRPTKGKDLDDGAPPKYGPTAPRSPGLFSCCFASPKVAAIA